MIYVSLLTNLNTGSKSFVSYYRPKGCRVWHRYPDAVPGNDNTMRCRSLLEQGKIMGFFVSPMGEVETVRLPDNSLIAYGSLEL